MTKAKGLKRVLYFLVVTLISIGAAYFFSNGRLFSSARFFFICTSWSMCIWFSQSLGNGYIIDSLDKRISWLESPLKRLLIGFVALVIYSFTAFQVVQIAFEYFAFGYQKEDFFESEEFWSRFFESGRIAVMVSIGISTVMTSIGFLRGWKQAAVNAEVLKKEVVAQQYEALRSQMNPHFLFNSLNVLTELVYEDQDQAVRFIRKLSDVYRYVLDSREKELVSLEEELHFAKSYASLLEERFGSNFSFVIKGEEQLPNASEYIVPMALQLLLENAVKHNVVSKSEPLEVVLEFKKQSIRFSNQINLKRNVESTGSLGLTYMKNRYASLEDQEVNVTDTNGEFVIEIPYLYVTNEDT